MTPFYTKIANSTAHRPIRDELSAEALANPNLLRELFDLALNTADKYHHKACWILELVLGANISLLEFELAHFCNNLPNYKHEGALRSVAKICMFAVQHHQKSNAFLNDAQLQQITEAAFDWLINPNGKVATKAYAMRTLYFTGKQTDWIYPELTRILAEDTVKHTAAYKAAAKDILKKINK